MTRLIKGASLLNAARRLGDLYERHVAKQLGTSDAKKLRALHEDLNLKLAASPPS